MRIFSILAIVAITTFASAAEIDERFMRSYIAQDKLEEVVRKEKWVDVVVNQRADPKAESPPALVAGVRGGVRKGDLVRIWTGGFIDRGNGDRPGENVAGPEGAKPPTDPKTLALSPQAVHAYALLFKLEGDTIYKSAEAGKPLEFRITKDNEKLFIGFNDERGKYADNHIGKGRKHETEPLWVRIEVYRTVVD